MNTSKKQGRSLFSTLSLLTAVATAGVILASCAKPAQHLRWHESPSYSGGWLGSLDAGEIREALREGPVFMTLDQNALKSLLPYDKTPYGGSTFMVEAARRDRLIVKRVLTGVSSDGMPSVDHHEFSIKYLRAHNPQFFRTTQVPGPYHEFKKHEIF